MDNTAFRTSKRSRDVEPQVNDDVAAKRLKNEHSDGNDRHVDQREDTVSTIYETVDLGLPTMGVRRNQGVCQTSLGRLVPRHPRSGTKMAEYRMEESVATSDIDLGRGNAVSENRRLELELGEEEEDDTDAASQPLTHAATPELSTASSSRGNSSAPEAQTPVTAEDSDCLHSKKKPAFTLHSEALYRALQSKHLSENFMEKFCEQHPEISNTLKLGSVDSNNEKLSSQSAFRIASAPSSARKSKPEASTPPFECPSSCSGKFNDVSSFRQHLEMQHASQYKVCKHSDCSKFVANNEDIGTSMLLGWHYRKDHGQHALQCMEHPNCNYKPTLDEKAFVEHVKSHRLRCNLCLDEKKRALPFGTVDALKLHIKNTHGEGTFQCQGYDFVTGKRCTRRFPTEGGRTKHMGCAHKGQFLCPHCMDDGGKVQMFETEKTLALHVRDAHAAAFDDDWAAKAGVKRFACPQCKKVLTKNVYLQRHLATHTGETPKPFRCNATDVGGSPRMTDDDGTALAWDPAAMGCESRFATKQSLIDHVRSAHLGLMRWEAFRRARSGQAWQDAASRMDRKDKRAKPSPTGVLSGFKAEPAS
ncbi:uncharacterized protein PV09_08287 [Verruconis gallopava]|uniref:C2H2-type domain-containing protein n=1 Tax=Verruconis gallopava TaxID=253628 RepID=A0A0D1YH18_9PEZI|nr:uncharacterized protein PV09_08287 [Verruconis gallopava]KIW00102.1 hypothetical protein PV09_08287 [Verruconis gallopava]